MKRKLVNKVASFDFLLAIFYCIKKKYDCLQFNEEEGFSMHKDMKYGSDFKYIPTTSIWSGEGVEVFPD